MPAWVTFLVTGTFGSVGPRLDTSSCGKKTGVRRLQSVTSCRHLSPFHRLLSQEPTVLSKHTLSYSPPPLSSFPLLHKSSIVISFSMILEILFYVVIIFTIIFLKSETAASTFYSLSCRVQAIKLAFNKHLLVRFFLWGCLRFAFAFIFSGTLLMSVRPPFSLDFSDKDNGPFAWIETLG